MNQEIGNKLLEVSKDEFFAAIKTIEHSWLEGKII